MKNKVKFITGKDREIVFKFSKPIGNLLAIHKPEPLSIAEMVQAVKEDKNAPALSQIKLTNEATGEVYTFEEIDKILNNYHGKYIEQK